MEACFAFVSTLQKPAQPVTLHLRNYLNRVETIKRAHSGSGQGPERDQDRQSLGAPVRRNGRQAPGHSQGRAAEQSPAARRSDGWCSSPADRSHQYSQHAGWHPGLWPVPPPKAGPRRAQAHGALREEGGSPPGTVPRKVGTMSTWKVPQHRVSAALTPRGGRKTSRCSPTPGNWKSRGLYWRAFGLCPSLQLSWGSTSQICSLVSFMTFHTYSWVQYLCVCFKGITAANNKQAFSNI